ncbi:MAG: YtxH domain-containing protein [Anaerolineae bacterium]|jgi:gas vesicle protein
MGDKNSGVDFLAGFFVGALVGAAAALLLAPQSGEETRTIIRERGIELKDRADDLSLEAKKRAEELQAQAKTKADELQARVQDAVEEGKIAASSQKEELLASLEEPPAQEAAAEG